MVEPIYAAREVEQRLQSLGRDGVTLAIVDTAAGVSAATVSAIRYADFCLIPARPSIAEYRSDRRDAQCHQGLAKAVRLRHEPDPDPERSTPRQRGKCGGR